MKVKFVKKDPTRKVIGKVRFVKKPKSINKPSKGRAKYA
jgi:hypothetical protein